MRNILKTKIIKFAFIFFIIIIFSHLICLKIFKNELINQKSYSQIFYDKNDILLRLTLSGDEKFRILSSYNESESHFSKAILAKEDQYYFYHFGFNPISLIRAIYQTYIKHGNRQGASTITMQVVRLLYPETTKSITGKLFQIVQGVKLEFLYSKKEILSAYLNWIPFGSNIEGMSAACQIYFNKKNCDLLTNKQIHYLIQIPQNPQKYTSVANQLKRQKDFKAPHFVDSLLSSGMESKQVETSLDFKLNENINSIADKYFLSQSHLGIKNYSVMIVDSRTNSVLSYIGSVDYFKSDIKGQIDANRTLKSPGSTLKPFIYALALQEGIIHEKTLLKDTKMTFGGINPENFDQQYFGPLAADQALILSRNLPAAELSTHLIQPSLYEFLKDKSSLRFKDEKFYGLALPLGGVEFSMIDLVKLYSSLANKGKYSELNFYKKSKTKTSSQILTPEASYIVLQMLKKNPRHEGTFISGFN